MERGITLPRLFAMVSAHDKMEKTNLHAQGVAASLAYHEPKKLKDLIKDAVQDKVDMEALPAMLRIPKKKKALDHG